MKKITINKSILTENTDLIQDYFKDVAPYKVYSGDEQVELARLAKQGDESAREKLVTSNLRFVITCAKQYVGHGVPLMDLISSGNEGLLMAIRNYDPDRGYKFLSFAVWYIRREILKAIYNTGRTIRYPVTYISKITKVKKAYDKFVEDNQRDPTEDELLNLTNLTQKQYASVVIDKSYCESIDTPVSDDGNLTIGDSIPAEPTQDVFTREEIIKCLGVLEEREAIVIKEFYGLDGNGGKSIKDIAAELGLGDERVRQLRKSAIKKLFHRRGNVLKTLL